MRIFHTADLHYAPKHLDWVDEAFGLAVDAAIAKRCEIAVIAGDSFDCALPVHEPSVPAYLRQVARLADHMPVLVLHGTYSHDRPGSLDIVHEIGQRTKFVIWVAEGTGRMALRRVRGALVWDDDFQNDGGEPEPGVEAIVCAMPSLNKADPEIMEMGANAWVERTLSRWANSNHQARAAGIPTVLVTHGTVGGSVTESGFALVSPDHEFTTKVLSSAETDAVLLGHIHKHQVWRETTPHSRSCTIAYPGSIARLVYGQTDPTGYMIWDVLPGEICYEFIPVPGRQLADISFQGPPNMDDLEEAAGLFGVRDHVRIRWEIDEEKAHLVDKAAIRALFAHVAHVKLECTVHPIQSVRAGGIGKALRIEDKIALWAKTTGDSDRIPALCSRLSRLKDSDIDHIVEQFMEEVDKSTIEEGV